MSFVVRPLTAQDEHFLWEMLYQAIYVPEGNTPPPRSILQEPSLAQYVRQWGQMPADLGCVVVDEASGQPVGAAWLRLFSQFAQPEKGYGYVDDQTPELSIAILPAYRGQGVGTLLLNNLLDTASQRFAAVSLSVSSENPAARLYQRLGFVVVTEHETSNTMLKRFK